MSLPNDVCRCVGTTCGKRDTCQRFTESPTGNEWTPYANLSPEPGQQCAFFIPQEPILHEIDLTPNLPHPSELVKFHIKE